MQTRRIVLLGALVLAAAAVGAMWLSRPASLPDPLAEITSSADAQEAANVEITEMVMGDSDAPVTVVEYASFTCPHCRHFHEEVLPLLKKDYIDTGKVKLVYREVYFDKYGLWASLVARCGGPEKFFGIADMIYKAQDKWTRAGSDAGIADELRKIGRLAGIDGDTLEACLTDEEKIRALVEWYRENAQRDGISSTPSFVIDGKKYSNMPYDEMRAILDAEL